MFKKILIANRGEIACRDHQDRPADGDRDGRGLFRGRPRRAACRDGRRGGSDRPAARGAKSICVIDKIIAACKETGAEAVHPGYGFLSEREAFAEALADGRHRLHRARTPRPSPPWATRSRARSAAAAAKVSTVPGYLGVIEDARRRR